MILITGASGLLGGSLVAAALRQNREVVGLYHRHPLSVAGAGFFACDLTDDAEVHRIFNEVNPSSVINCAAATNVDWCQDHPDQARAINSDSISAIAEITALRNIRLLHISTDSVFDGERGSYSETDSPAPVNLYATTKFLAEREVLRRNPAATVTRVNFYGWGARKESLAEWVLTRLSNGLPVPGFSDVLFCPILADDLAEILLTLLDRNLSGVYHVVGSEPISKYEFARRVASAFGFDPAEIVPTSITAAQLKAPRPRNTTLSTGKICSALGRSMPDVEAGLRRFAESRKSAALT
jgi:dTDP-4-dehydrorhamnose reductase